ncbi:MAG: 3-deoxy-manno-octulosonate cytidylyltransferase (CMP-KDO synthetase) [Pseudoalteromonas tetraodonis]|uniref:3-deoxy-manno-octulosonate cytidylyltransferase n=1 Tax=Pseudoalteromonas tetraodonis GFC TaxID=1315271 RepID=A0AA37W509_9GAMM|nr:MULTISPECIES: 3-deoxy-manno-octulosonate cytidylyltransferase [Pseudoalteromonas]MAY58171.1 3-deoxy-manno-octulosonate cytidylyltransferase [Pseudoalteromonas sp.]ATD03273.1 3-deoxy-manno-octulosonate cytidylyltransferase (CMP-KDO synthetase) [Pseudoalteromonas tetraodonis]MDN3403667.1 3-deoxy-manno-octulosonate cytidylyltransferase [Pseudoalteromonas sp. APC 3218]MDN3407506.1 3-deoxy-manno-octulosonate cytidylyltransferase [Pseudoalteromonas sp. APC 3894]MDN3414817.1 3-deoxy-manno-octuloso
MEFVVVIPARYASTRLPGKPLADICGKPMIQHVYEKACLSGASKVVIATDHQKVFDAAKHFTNDVLMTREDHQSGTERLAEVVDLLNLSEDTIVVNVQGDEPLLSPDNVSQVATLLAQSTAPMATLSVAIEERDEVFNPNAVKVVSDINKNALYFSRASIPFDRSAMMAEQQPLNLAPFQRHVGIYAYRAGFIKQYIQLSVSPLEVLESLEQLRVLYHGYAIKIEQALVTPHAGVDTPEDLAKVVAHIQSKARE